MIGSICFLSLLLNFMPAEDSSGLEKAVHTYWDHLLKGEKSQALEFVLSESRNNFILRNEPFMRSWKLSEISPKSKDQATVTVTVERLIQGGFYNWKVTEDWVLQEGSWKVRIRDHSDEIRSLYCRPTVPSPTAGVLELVPDLLKIHFLSRTQQGSIVIRNGLRQAVQLDGLEYDREKFELVEKSDSVGEETIGRITLRYRGQETGKNLRSQVTVTLKHGSKEESYLIPIIYNYLSPGARGLLGLTREEGERLTRDDKLTAKITLPPRNQMHKQTTNTLP